ncbi:MAG: 1-acyl-sn-glycerol-3-phosphate acyltransferase [Chloroflexi bacterium]|nr:1-acyl-sn-glycerol-3-phosphate acyltransferase [Chloroflexota bacterium]
MRSVLRRLIQVGFSLLTDFEIRGQENLPRQGPLLVVANHFAFVDPAAVIRAVPWPIEFVGGFHMPNAPSFVTWIPKIWGFLPVFRGAYSRQALRDAEAILAQRGVLGIFPEAGSWASVLRPARPGTAFLADRTGAQILPIGLDGLVEVFPRLRHGRRSHVTVNIGKPFGPLAAGGHGRQHREQLEEIGHSIMRRIAELIPPEKRGHYSDDAAIRAAAQGTEIYPFDQAPDEAKP